MSHVTEIAREETWELDPLKTMCEMMGWEFIEGQTSFAWYGTHMGDYPVPRGFSKADMGKCHHAIRIPGAKYEIGVVERDGEIHLLWDFWHSGGLPRVLGNDAGLLTQAYDMAKVVRAVKRERRGVRMSIRDEREERVGWKAKRVVFR